MRAQSRPALQLDAEEAANLAIALAGREAWGLRQIQLAEDTALAAFLQRVLRLVPYYRDSVRGGDCQLGAFPLTTRSDHLAAGGDFRAAGSTADTFSATSSGTTGRPLPVLFDAAAWYDLNYGSYERLAQLVPELQAATPGATVIVLVGLKPERTRQTLVMPGLNYSRFARETLGCSRALDRRVLRRLRDRPPIVLHGKPSYLLALAQADTATGGPRRVRPRALVLSGESLFSNVRSVLEEHFDCRAFNAYTSVEGGLIAVECSDGAGLHIMADRVHLEVRRGDGTVAPGGTGELLLTNKVNRVTTFVRYRTGDTAALRTTRCNCGATVPTIDRFWGREARQFTIGSRTVECRDLDDVLCTLPLEQYELTQTGTNTFCFRFASGGKASSGFANRIRAVCLAILGDVRLDIHAVESLGPPGGKVVRYRREAERLPSETHHAADAPDAATLTGRRLAALPEHR